MKPMTIPTFLLCLLFFAGCARQTFSDGNKPKTRYTTEELNATVGELDSLTEQRIKEIDSLKRLVTGEGQ